MTKLIYQKIATNKLVEIGFTTAHSDFKSHSIIKKMVESLVDKAKNDGFEWIFSKVYKDNLVSSKSLIKNGFDIYSAYIKPVSKESFIFLSLHPLFSTQGKGNAKTTLNNNEIIVDYPIAIKNLR